MKSLFLEACGAAVFSEQSFSESDNSCYETGAVETVKQSRQGIGLIADRLLW